MTCKLHLINNKSTSKIASETAKKADIIWFSTYTEHATKYKEDLVENGTEEDIFHLIICK